MGLEEGGGVAGWGGREGRGCSLYPISQRCFFSGEKLQLLPTHALLITLHGGIEEQPVGLALRSKWCSLAHVSCSASCVCWICGHVCALPTRLRLSQAVETNT